MSDGPIVEFLMPRPQLGTAASKALLAILLHHLEPEGEGRRDGGRVKPRRRSKPRPPLVLLETTKGLSLRATTPQSEGALCRDGPTERTRISEPPMEMPGKAHRLRAFSTQSVTCTVPRTALHGRSSGCLSRCAYGSRPSGTVASPAWITRRPRCLVGQIGSRRSCGLQ